MKKRLENIFGFKIVAILLICIPVLLIAAANSSSSANDPKTHARHLVHGRLVDKNGNPLKFTPVTYVYSQYFSPNTHAQIPVELQTDENGYFYYDTDIVISEYASTNQPLKMFNSIALPLGFASGGGGVTASNVTVSSAYNISSYSLHNGLVPKHPILSTMFRYIGDIYPFAEDEIMTGTNPAIIAYGTASTPCVFKIDKTCKATENYYIAGTNTPLQNPTTADIIYNSKYKNSPPATITQDGTTYTYKGYQVGTSEIVYTNEDVLLSDIKTDIDINFYYERNINVAFNANEGTPTTSKQYEAAGVLGVLPEVTRPDYSFEGWWTAPEGGVEVTADTVVGTLFPTGNSGTVYAQWKKNMVEVTVEYVDAAGVPLSGYPATIHEVIPGGEFSPVIPEVAGYGLRDWKLNGVAQGNTAPAISNITDPQTITLVYDIKHTMYIKYRDMEDLDLSGYGWEIEVFQGDPYTHVAATFVDDQCIGVEVDGNERDATKAYYKNDFVTSDHTVIFRYKPNATVINVTIPTKMIWASFASESGVVKAPDYSIENYSELPVDVTLASFSVIDPDGVNLVAASPAEGEYTLNMEGSLKLNSISGLVDSTSNKALGSLGINSSDRKGVFTFTGEYAGSYSTPKKPRFNANFRFSAVLPAREP